MDRRNFLKTAATGSALAGASLFGRRNPAFSASDPAATTLPASALGGSNPPWFPSLMAFEHYDSGRTKLFERAHFTGSFTRPNAVDVRISPDDYPTPYNVVYLGKDSLFVFGGAYGDKGGTGTFVARVDPQTLQTVWFNQLINTVETNEWNYPGVLSALQDGFLYQIYGYRLAKLDPRSGQLLGQIELPTLAEPRDTAYNGLDGWPDGTLVAKAIYRQKGCEEQGFRAFLNCPNPADIPNSVIVAIDPRTLEIIDQVVAPQPIGGRITATVFENQFYAYLPGQTTIFRYIYKDRHLRLDTSWRPRGVVLDGQNGPTAPAVMNDWIIVGTNSTPAATPQSVVAINQTDASLQFSLQPFAAVPSPQSWSPSAVTVDPLFNRIFVLDGIVGQVAALELRDDGLHTLWTAPQRTIEFLALIGSAQRRVLVGTDVPPDQQVGANTQDWVVWRKSGTGEEIARSPLLQAVNGGTMVEPGYTGRMYFLAQDGKIIELTVRPVSP
ncbi:MAG: twin-arginine translocation signal domain-containing protein [Terriglobia bacterium]